MQTLALNTGLKMDKGRDFVIRRGKLELERDDKYSKGIEGIFERAGYKTKAQEKKEESIFKEIIPIENNSQHQNNNSNNNDSLFQRLLGN